MKTKLFCLICVGLVSLLGLGAPRAGKPLIPLLIAYWQPVPIFPHLTAAVPSPCPPAPSTAQDSGPIPASAWPSMNQQIAEEQRAFRPAPDGSLHSFNATGGERLILHPDGSASLQLRGEESAAATPSSAGSHVEAMATVTAADDRPAVALRLKAESLGRGPGGRALTETKPVGPTGRHDTARGLTTTESGVNEWWKSRDRGFEVGWTIDRRPAGDGPLQLALSLDCPWPARVAADGRRVEFRDPAGSGWGMVCEGLLAWDATGRHLPAQLATAHGQMTISVDDSTAAYPLVIDPWLFADRSLLIRADVPQTGHRFGARLASCGDVLVAAARDPGSNDSFSGEVYILTRVGNSYGVRRKITGVLRPQDDSTSQVVPFAVSGDVVAVGAVAGAANFKVIIHERDAGGPLAFASVAEIDLGAASYLPSVQLSGDLLAVTHLADSSGGFANAGTVRIHQRHAGGPSAWGQVAVLDAGDFRQTDGYFGISTALQGGTLAVIASTGASVLTCFLFEAPADGGPGWTRKKTFPLPGQSFSLPTLRLMGDTLAVRVGGEGVRLFERHAGGPDQWGLSRSLTAPAGEPSFGFSMAMLGSLLAVSAPDEAVDHDNNSATAKIEGAGVVRIYGRDAGGVNGWGLVQTYSPGLAAELNGRHGDGLAFSEGRLLIGRPKGDTTLPAVSDAGVVENLALSSGTWLPDGLTTNGQNSSGYGSALAVSGPYVLVGAPRFDGPSGVDAGWAFLFRDGVLIKSLLPTGQQAGEQFGSSVAMDGDRLVVGSPLRSGFLNIQNYPDLGAVTIFERNQGGADNWGVVKSFSQPSLSTASSSPEFGTSLALQGDILAVGAPLETALSLPGVSVKGRVKIFARNTGGADNWGQVRSFQGEDHGTDEFYGTSVSLSGDTLVVGAPGEEISGLIRAGAAYVHRRNEGGPDNWGRVARLIQPVTRADSFFGYAVAVDGDDILIGAPREDQTGEPNAGAVYFFAGGRVLQDEWTLTRQWQPEEWGTEFQGGTSVALSQGFAVIGVPNAPGTSGEALLLAKHAGGPDQWGLIGSENGQESFGSAVAMNGLFFAVGEPLAEVSENSITYPDRGRATTFRFQGGEFAAVAMREGGPGAARLGTSVALQGDWLVVGAPDEDVNADVDAGAAYVFHRDRPSPGAWGLVQRLVDVQDNAANTRFGAALALDATWLMVGVPGAHRVQAYYRQDQATPQGLPWVDSVSLSAGGQPNALGSSLAMADGVLLAGAPLQDVSGNVDSGAVYRFERNMAGADQWGLQGPLTPLDPGAGDAFGTSVALAEHRAAVGAPLDNNAEGTDAGAVYLFERNEGGANTWGQAQKITNSVQAANDEMGRSVALRNGLLLTGLPRATTPAGTSAGRALLFSRNQGSADNWGLLKNFSAPDGSAQSRFGSAVAIDADHAVIGAPFADPRGITNAGTAYVYSRDWTGDEAWALLQTLAPTEVTTGGEFGATLALDRSSLAFGAPGDATSGRVHLHLFRARALYDDWAATHGLEGQWALPAADADGDGQANLIELVLGSHPLDGSRLGQISLLQSGNQLILTAHKDRACSVPVFFTAEVSANLTSWAPANPAQVLADNASLLQIQLSVTPVLRQYARWRATLP